MKPQNLGVIQGTKNGPLFFDIYSGDFNKLCDSKENIHFADDTCLVYSGESLPELVEHVNNKLAVILDWCRWNKLAINPTKSEYLLVTNRDVPYDPQIYMGTERIFRKKTVKYLGLYVDDGFKFSSHIDQLKIRLSRFSGIAYKLKNFMNLRAAKNYYYSCVYSTLTYCISVYGGALQSHRGSMLINTHNRIVNTLFRRFKPDSCPLKAQKLLKLVDIYHLYAGIHMYKILKLNINETVGDTIELETATHPYETRNRDLLQLPFPRVNGIRINYKYKFIDIWNNIPENIKDSGSLKRFKLDFMNHVIHRY